MPRLAASYPYISVWTVFGQPHEDDVSATWQDVALGLAGLIGVAVAIVHGVITQRLMVRPIIGMALTERRFSKTIGRMVPLLLQFSTAVWFAGGLALAIATQLDREARLAICFMVGGTYLFGAIGNCWATRGRHPGWLLMSSALVLITFGAIVPRA